MHAGNDNDLLIDNPEEEGIWKPVKKRTPGFAVNDWKPIWVLFDGTKNQRNLVQIFIP